MSSGERSRRWTVPAADAGSRLDGWLAARAAEATRSRIGRDVRDGRVHVDGRPAAKPGLRLRGGEAVHWSPRPEPADEPAPEPLELSLSHVDDQVAVVDKPAGMVVHPAPGHEAGTLASALRHHLGTLSTAGGRDRPGVVHRLDRDTSGLLVVARDDATHRALQERLRARAVSRRYLAVVHGVPEDDAGRFDTPYARDPRDRRRFTGRGPGTRRAVTRWRVLARGEGLAALACELETGRTHQIRVHLREAGLPVVADALYGTRPPRGGGGRLARERAAARRMPRQALHAAVLAFDHPVTGEPVRVTSEPPPDLRALLDGLFGAEEAAHVVGELLEGPGL